MKALLFDMDGVLVDVSRSYRWAIQECVQRLSGGNVSLRRIQEYKNRGGWNDDWALTRRIIEEMGGCADMDRVIEIFQEIYIGDHFNGLIRREKWLLEYTEVALLAERYPLGIVTGRPRAEAAYTQARFKMEPYFQVCVTRDDLPKGRGKPDPCGLKKALSRLGCCSGYYVGDSVDDMKAAVGAGLDPIGVIPPGERGTRLEERLRQSGARVIIKDINLIKEVLR